MDNKDKDRIYFYEGSPKKDNKVFHLEKTPHRFDKKSPQTVKASDITGGTSGHPDQLHPQEVHHHQDQLHHHQETNHHPEEFHHHHTQDNQSSQEVPHHQLQNHQQPQEVHNHLPEVGTPEKRTSVRSKGSSVKSHSFSLRGLGLFSRGSQETSTALSEGAVRGKRAAPEYSPEIRRSSGSEINKSRLQSVGGLMSQHRSAHSKHLFPISEENMAHHASQRTDDHPRDTFDHQNHHNDTAMGHQAGVSHSENHSVHQKKASGSFNSGKLSGSIDSRMSYHDHTGHHNESNHPKKSPGSFNSRVEHNDNIGHHEESHHPRKSSGSFDSNIEHHGHMGHHQEIHHPRKSSGSYDDRLERHKINSHHHSIRGDDERIEDHDPSGTLTANHHLMPPGNVKDPETRFRELEENSFKDDEHRKLEQEQHKKERERIRFEEEEERIKEADYEHPGHLSPSPAEEDRAAKKSIQDLFVYILFLVTASVIVFSMTSRSAYYMTDAMVAGFMETPFFHASENVTNPISDELPPEGLPSPPLNVTGGAPGDAGTPPGGPGSPPVGGPGSPPAGGTAAPPGGSAAPPGGSAAPPGGSKAPPAGGKKPKARAESPSERDDTPNDELDRSISDSSDENDPEDVIGNEQQEENENELWNNDERPRVQNHNGNSQLIDEQSIEPQNMKRDIGEVEAVTTEISTEENVYYEFPNETEESSERGNRRKRQSEFFQLGPSPRRSSLRARPEGGAAGGSQDEGKAQTLKGSTTIQDFWDFMETTFLNMIYWDFWYSYKDPMTHTEADDKLVFYSSKLLGVPRIRQVRVKSNTCTIHPQVSHLFKVCYGYYYSSTEDRVEMPPVNPVQETANAWYFTPAESLGTINYYGEFSNYGGGGYYIDMSLNRSLSEKRIKELKENLWINRGTRAVIIDFTIYNSNVNLFVVSKIVIELPPTGGIVPTGGFYALKLLRYVSAQDLVVLGFEFVFMFFIGYYSVTTTLQIMRDSYHFFFVPWNLLDVIILIFGHVCIICGLYRYFIVEPIVIDLMQKTQEHPEFDFPRAFQTNFDHLSAVLLFFLWIKFFKYLHFNQTISELNKTLARSTKGILAFTVMFTIIFFAFAQLAYLIFGTEVEEYKTVWSAAMSLLQAVLGKFNYRALEEAHFILGPIFLILFVFFIFFVLMNMFGAIIIESYKTVRSQIFPAKERMVATYLTAAATNIFTCGKGSKASKKDDSETTITYGKIRDALHRAGFTDVEVDIFFAKYDIRVDRDISGHEAKKLIAKLELRRFDFDPIDMSAQTVAELQKEFERMKKNVEELEKRVEIQNQQIRWQGSDIRATTQP